MQSRFPTLFTLFELGKYTLQSRIVVTGHAANFVDEDKLPTEDYGYYLRERAKGGAGMVTIGVTSVHPSSSAGVLNCDDQIVPRYRRIADLVHEFPVPVLTQLSHSGRNARLHDGDWLAIAPSPIPSPAFSYPQTMPHELSTEEVSGIVDEFSAGGRVHQVVQLLAAPSPRHGVLVDLDYLVALGLGPHLQGA